MFEIRYAEGVADDLKELRAYDQRIVVDRIKEQLTHEPAMETRAKKIITGLRPSFQYEEPLWQLRVGQYRVYYDVDIKQRKVNVRAIRSKPPYLTTEEVI
jgi:mRNA-degrading endonuclease RelE of RelBE toxin-antitoxin system